MSFLTILYLICTCACVFCLLSFMTLLPYVTHFAINKTCCFVKPAYYNSKNLRLFNFGMRHFPSESIFTSLLACKQTCFMRTKRHQTCFCLKLPDVSRTGTCFTYRSFDHPRYAPRMCAVVVGWQCHSPVRFFFLAHHVDIKGTTIPFILLSFSHLPSA